MARKTRIERDSTTGAITKVVTKPAAADARLPDGTFAPGSRHSATVGVAAGNDLSQKMHVNRQKLLTVFTPEACERVALVLLEQAERGDARAIEHVLDRAAGKPTVPMEITTQVDGAELHRQVSILLGVQVSIETGKDEGRQDGGDPSPRT